jgi:hypothetical protein
MTLMRFHFIHLIENTVFYVWHDSGNREIQHVEKKMVEKIIKKRSVNK